MPVDNNSNINPITGLPFNKKATPPAAQSFTSDVTPGVTFDPKQAALAAERGIPATPGIDFKQQLAANQSGWQAIKAGTFNALAGAVGELVSVPGYLLNLGSEMSELEDGLGGAFIKAGDFIKENAQEFAPLFTTAEQDEQVFAPFDGKWWGRTIEQLGPTLALLAASYATGGLASSGLAAASTRLGQVSRFAKLAQSLSKTPQAVGILNRAGTVASATLMSRATEGMMEGREIYNQTYDLALENGSSYDEATDLANEAAAFTYKWNWGATLTDAIQYTGIYGGFAGLGRLGKALAFGTEVGLESVEEGYQGIVGKEAIREAYKNMGLDVENNSLYDRIGEYLQDKEIQKAMVQGAMGATIVQSGGRFLNSAQNKILNKYYNQQRTQDNLKENNEKIKSFLDNNQFVEATSTAYNQVVNKWVNDIVNLPDGYDTAMQVVNMNLEKEDGELNTLYPEGFKIDGKKVEPRDYFETQKRYIESAKAIVDVTQQQHKNEPLTYQEELSKRQLEQNIIADRVNSLRQSYSVAATTEKGKYELSPLGERRYELKDELAAINKLLAEDIGESKDFLQNKKDYLENQLNELESNMKENDSETFNKDTEELSKYYENTATEYLYKKNKLENSSKNISNYVNNLLKEETKVQYRQQANQQLLIDLQEELSVTDTEKGFNDLLKKYARNEEATAIIKADYANKFSKEVKNISEEGFSPAEVEEESKKTSEVSDEQIQFFADKLQDLIQNNDLTGSKILSDLGVTSAQELAKLYYDKNRPEDRKRIQAYFAQFKQDSDTTELGEEIVDTEGVKPSDETTPMPDYSGSPNQVIFAEAVMYKVKRDTNGSPVEATFTINKGVTPKSIKPTDKTDFEINWDSNGWQVLKDENGVFVANNNWDYLNVDTKNISNLNISDKVELEVNLEDDFVKKQVKDGNIKNLAITVTDTKGNALGNLSVLSSEQLELVRNRVWSELQEYVKTNGLKGKFNPSFNLTVSNINGGRFNSINQLNELYTVLGNEDVTLGVGIIDNGRFSIKLPNLNSTKPKHKDILENFNNNPVDVTPESTVKAGHVYAIIKNPYDKKYYPYRLFTKKLNDTNLKGKVIDIISKVGVDPRMDSDRAMMELQDIVRFVKVNKNGKTNYAPDIADNFHSESNVLFAPKGKMHAKLEEFKNENPEATPEQLNRARAEIFYEMTDMGNKIVQINNSKLNPLLNTPAYNKRIIEEGRMSTDLAKHNGEFFHSPMVAIDLSPVDKAKPKTKTTTEQPTQQADIERRRKEELDAKFDKQQLDFFKDGWSYAVAARQPYFNFDGKYAQQKYDEFKEINAKYDKEIARVLTRELASGTGRVYTDFTLEEKRILDLYQYDILVEEGLIAGAQKADPQLIKAEKANIQNEIKELNKAEKEELNKLEKEKKDINKLLKEIEVATKKTEKQKAKAKTNPQLQLPLVEPVKTEPTKKEVAKEKKIQEKITKVINTELSSSEKKILRDEAKKIGLSVSEFVSNALGELQAGTAKFSKKLEDVIKKIYSKVILAMVVVSMTFNTVGNAAVIDTSRLDFPQTVELVVDGSFDLNKLGELHRQKYGERDYAVLDKESRTISIFDKQGNLIYENEAIIGKHKGDFRNKEVLSTIAYSQKAYDLAGLKITPSGIFEGVKKTAGYSYGANSTWSLSETKVERTDGTSSFIGFHANLSTREALIGNNDISDNAASMGCFGVNLEDFKKIEQKLGDKVSFYILPETDNRDKFDEYLKQYLTYENGIKDFQEWLNSTSEENVEKELNNLEKNNKDADSSAVTALLSLLAVIRRKKQNGETITESDVKDLLERLNAINQSVNEVKSNYQKKREALETKLQDLEAGNLKIQEPNINSIPKSQFNNQALESTTTVPEVTPTEKEAKKVNKLLGKKPKTRFGRDNFPKAKLATKGLKMWDKNQELAWFRKNFPNYPIHVLEAIKNVRATGGKMAWGLFTDAAVYIAENAGQGTTYHEAFHLVFTLGLTSEQQAKILNEAREKYPKETKGKTGLEVEEFLADKFSEFVLNEGKVGYSLKNLPNIIKGWFKRMYQWVKSIATDNINIDELFFRASSGIYKNLTPITKDSPSFLKYSLPEGIGTNQELKARLNLVNDLYFRNHLLATRKESANQFKSISELIREMIDTKNVEDNVYFTIYHELYERFYDDNGNLFKEYQPIENKINAVLTNLFYEDSNGSIKPGPLYKEALKDLTSKYNTGLNFSEDLLDESLVYESNDNKADKESWQKAVFSSSPYESLNDKMLLWFSSIPKQKITGKDADGNITIENINDPDFGEGFPLYENPKDVKSFLINKLAGVNNTIKMEERLRELEGTRPWITKIINDIQGDQDLKTLLFQFTQRQTPNFKFIKQDGNSIQIIDSNRNTVERTIRRDIEAGLKSKGDIITIVDGKNVFNENRLERYLRAIETVKVDGKNVRERIANLFEAIGFPVEKEVLDYFFTDSAEIKGNKTITNTAVNKRTRLLNSFKSLFTDMSKGKDPFVGQNDSIISIVRQIKDASPSYYQAVHRGLDGQKIYNHIRPTFFGKLRQQIIDGSFLFEEYQKDAFLENNLFIGKDGYYTDPAMRENFQFDIIEGIQEDFSKTEYSRLSDLQFEKTAFTLFLGNGNAAIQRKFANYLLPILETAPVMLTTGFKVYDRTELLNEFVKLAQAEAARQSNYALALEKGIDLGVYRTEESLLFLDNEGNPLFDLTDVNKPEIRDVIEGWMDLQVQNEIQRFEEIGLTKELEKTQFKATPTAVELYTLNNLLVRAHLAAITTGDIAFYKNTEDFFKRAKEIWSPGEYLDTNREEVHPNTQFIFIEDVENLTPTWVEAFKEAATKKGMSEEVVNKMAEAYTESVNITDAQAFITPQRWLEQEYGLGRVTNKTLATFERLMRGEETPSDMRTILQTRKPFIFTHNILPLTNSKNLVTPLQIKNSEMVLLPSMVKGRPELEAIYNRLTKLEQTGEGMKATAVFGSGVKVGSYGVMTLNENNQLEGGITHILDNSAWRLQVETPQHHIDAKSLLGSQLWKVVTGNLKDPMLQSMAQEFDTLLNADIEFKYEKLMKDLSPEKGVSKPLNLILEEAYKRGVGKQFEGITQDIDRNDPKGLFKLFMNPYTTYKAQSLINSLFRNRITKRKINGGSFYNTSSLGYNDLEVVFNEDGSLAHFEVYLPSWLKDVTIEALGEKAREGVVYRIPTEGKYSMFNIKVKGFLPAEAGGNIIMPHGVTTIAGLDFDIDKVYAIFYNLRKNREGKYEPIPYLDMANSEPIDRYLEKFHELKGRFFEESLVRNEFSELREEIEKVHNIVKEEKWYQDILKDVKNDLQYERRDEARPSLIANEFDFAEIAQIWNLLSSKVKGDKFLANALLNMPKDDKARDLKEVTDSIKAHNRLKKSSKEALHELNSRVNEFVYNYMMEQGEFFTIKEFETLPIELQNTQKARDNRKLDIIKTILSESTSEVFTPGNFDTIKEVAGKIRELEGKSKENLLPFSNSTYSEIFRRMMDGSALIGPAAINNKSHALFQRSNLTMTLEDSPLLIKPVMDVNGVEFKKSKKNGKYTYEIDGEVVETETFLVRLKSEAIKLGKMRGFNGDLLSLTFNEQLAAVVDNGKDPLANIFNLNLYTTDVFNTLLHMGYDLETSMLFTAQPVIKELVKRISNKETTDAETLSEIKTEYKQSIVANIKSEKYLEKVNEVLTSTFYNTLDVQQLEDSIKAHTKAKAEGKSYPDYFYLTQLKVLRNFELMKQKEAKDISNVIRNINTGDNGPGATLADNLLLVDLQDRVIEDSNIENANEFLNDDSKPINNLRRKGVVEAANYLTQTVGLPFNNSMFKKLRQKMNNSKPNSVIVAKDIDKLNFNVLTALATELYQTNGVEMLTTFPQEFLELKAAESKKEEGSNFSELFNFFKVDMEGNNPRFMLSNSTGLDESQLDFVREQFELLAEERPELFQKFVDYNFHAYGFEFTPFSYSHTLPTQLVSEGLVETLDRGLSEFTVDKMTEFYEQFLRNHFVSLKYLPYVKEDKFKKLEGGAVILEDLSGVRIAKNPVKYIKSNVDNTPQLFVLDSFTDVEAVYLPVPRLGSHNLGIEYNLNVPGYVSKLNFNTKKTVKDPKTKGFTPILKQGNQMEEGFTPITNNIPSQEFSEAAGTLGSPLESGFTPIKESALTTEKMKLIGSEFMQTYENAEVEYGNIMKLAKNDKISLEQFNEYIEKLKKC